MKQLLIISAILTSALFASAQQQYNSSKLTSVWETMPDSLCAFKSEAKIDTTISNDNCLYINITKASSLQIGLLKDSNNADIICLINTYLAPEAESHLTYYDTNWNQIGSQSFDFSLFSSDSTFQKLFVPVLISAKLNSDKTLTINLSDKNITDEDRKLINFPLNKIIKWNGSSYE